MATVSGDSPVVVRPRTRLGNRQSGRGAAAAGAVLASVFYSLQFHGWARVVVVGAGVALAVGLVGLISLSLRRTNLAMIGGQLIFTKLLGDRVVRVGDGAGRVVKVQVDWGMASGRRSRFWLLIDAAGRKVLGLNCDVWDDGELEGVRERLGLPIEIVEMPMRPAELRKAYPGTISWWGAHPVAATVLAIVIITGSIACGATPERSSSNRAPAPARSSAARAWAIRPLS